jgi:epoxyqueuosine reductase
MDATLPEDDRPDGIAAAILRQARAFGASMAGLARVRELQRAPSFTTAARLPGAGRGITVGDSLPGWRPGEVRWPAGAASVLVIALCHPAQRPELDWWQGHDDPAGNRILRRIARQLAGWIEARWSIAAGDLPYHVEKGGIFLKDAAVLAGLGCIGRNNLLLSPRHGPRLRLRALSLAAELPPTGPMAFDPCSDCDAPCRRACPQRAFEGRGRGATACDQDRLPGRDGAFARPACMLQMQRDIDAALTPRSGSTATVPTIRYCRACELSCPVGRP